MLPDFLCIGAQKAGTTWLYENLGLHPQVWLPPKKEVHFFDHLERGRENRWRRLQDPRWRRQLNRRLVADIKNISIRDAIWDCRYFFGKFDDDWYQSLFQPAAGQIAGDITPAYSAIDRSAVRHVNKLISDARIILILRNPIERAWSHALMDLAKIGKKQINQIDDELFIRHFTSHESLLRGNYARIMENWLSVYSREQFFIGFLEDIAQRPSGFITELLDFLQIEGPSGALQKNVDKTVHKGRGYTIPLQLQDYLARLYQPGLERLLLSFSGYQADYIRGWMNTSHG